MYRRSLCTALLIILPLVCAIASQDEDDGEIRIIIPPAVIASSERIILGEIADIMSNEIEMVERLRTIELGYAPDVGAVRELTREKIAMAIAAAGFPANIISIDAPSLILVRRATVMLDLASVREEVERTLLSELRAKGAIARLVRLDLPQEIEIPAADAEIRVSAGQVRDLFSPFAVSIEVRGDGRILRRLSVTAQVEAYAPVLVAAQNLALGQRLSEQDVIVKPCRLKKPLSCYLREAHIIRATTLKYSVAQGEPLTTDAVFADIIIKPGDAVRIIGRSNQVYVEVEGEARAAGRRGERIQVKNIASGVSLLAVIEDAGIVSISF
ncbi:MAG: flagellar basal body P-ring formation chaperone FlgA [Acidobacteriota bacterium]